MATPDGPEPADPGERFDIDIEQFAAATGGTAKAQPAVSPEANDRTIPTVADQPALPLLDGAPLRENALDELLAFYAYGARPDGLAGTTPPTPALLHGYGDLSRIRHDYPLCLTREGEGGAVLPLRMVVDGVIEKIDAQGDEAERLRRHLLRLESQMRSMLDGSGNTSLEQLWEGAAARVLEGSQDEALRENLTAARKALATDADVVALGDDTPRELLVAIAAREWKQRSSAFGTELEGILRGLEDILRVDESHTAEANSPEHLRSASGKGDDDEVDFLAMSSLLGSSHLGAPLPAERRERIRSAVNMIRLASPLFEAKDLEENPPIGVTRISTDPAAAHAGYESRMQLMANFFRAVRIARIEIANGYRPEVHDPFFEHFDATYLTEEEWALCPPVLVLLDPADYDGRIVDTIVALVARGATFKVLVPFDDLLPDDEAGAVPALMTGPQARLASMITALGHVHVVQCSASRVDVLADGIAAGYAYPGPSVVAVYTGGRDTTLPRFLSASAAEESRAFAAFEFHPGRGDTWEKRMDMRANPEPEALWPSGTFTWRTPEGEEGAAELPFTIADFLMSDPRLAGNFLSVGPDRWHENLVPLDAYMAMSDADTERRVPYITGVDAEGRVRRVAVSHAVVDAVASCASFWKSLQELGGINNSHALALLEAERARLEEEKNKAVADLEVKYSADLEQNIGDLTREIVQRIASQLLSGQSLGQIGDVAAAPMAPRPAAAAPAAPAPATQAPAEEAAPVDEEDDVIALDDPYIDTPLCTSCNDCFKINDRLFAYNENKQAYIADADAGSYKDLVSAAEICPVKIIHPGKPRNPNEEGLEELQKRAQPFL